MKIGNIEIRSRLALAPMAGVADRAFRELCVEYGACRQAVKTSDCGSDMHGFESHQAPHLH